MNKYYFERLSARFVKTTISLLHEHSISLVFASPLSARSPDMCLLWHSGYREKHKLKLILQSILSVFIGCLKGVIRLTINFKPYGYVLYGKINQSLLVITSTCGYKTENGFHTQYVFKDEDDGVFVFGPLKSLGTEAQKFSIASRKVKLLLVYELTIAGLVSFCRLDGSLFHKFLLLCKWLTWTLGLQWHNDYCFEQCLSKIVCDYNIKKIGCIHEMHYYSRIVWRIASKYKVSSYAVQHATVAPGKRWYFSYTDEQDAGLEMPHVFYVYNKRVVEMFKPFYKDAKFILGCSCRYEHWKNVSNIRNFKGYYYLFVGALAKFDNEILITALRKFLSTTTEQSTYVRLRLHPAAHLSLSDRNWIKNSSNNNVIELSTSTSLKNDIEGSKVVIGMSTSVLEESLLLGVPVIKLTHPDYLEYIEVEGVQGAKNVEYNKLSIRDMEDIFEIQVDVVKMRDNMGLDQPLVTYKQLFLEN